MSMSFRVAAFPIILTALLSACAAGGGSAGDSGLGGGVVGTPNFTSFAAIRPNQTAVMSGVSQTASGTSTSLKLNPINGGNSTTSLTYDRDRKVTGMRMNTPQSSVAFGGGEITERFDPESRRRTAYRGQDANSFAVAFEPAFFGWNYQTFGVWMKDVSSTAFQAGAMSAGAVTPASALPTGLTNASFTGHASGFYFDGAGKQFATDAKMSAVTDFRDRSIQFSTTGTLLTDISSDARTSDSTLDLRGNWNYAPGTSQFAGGVRTVNGDLTGDASGRFYGPNAEEIGGVYGLTGSGGRRMLGGFGGKR